MSDNPKRDFAQRQFNLGIDPVKEGQTKVWRYMNLEKFLFLIETRCLYFCRLDLLGDTFEGFPTKKDFENRAFPGGPVYRDPNVPIEVSDSYEEVRRISMLNYFEGERWKIFVSCWHIADQETAAMWEVYGGRGASIAIESTVQKLRSALPKSQTPSGTPQEGHVDLGKVRYFDFENDITPDGYTFDRALNKRRSFESDQELRLLKIIEPEKSGGTMVSRVYSESLGEVTDPLAEDPERKYLYKKPATIGESIEVDLDILIERVHISPSSPDWLSFVLGSLIERHSLSFNLQRSRLNDLPDYG